MKLLDCALIGVCVVIRSNMIFGINMVHSIKGYFLGLNLFCNLFVTLN